MPPQDLNPLPFPVMFANCVGWVAYTFVIDDIYVYVPNEIGLMLGAFYTLSCYGLVDSKVGGEWLGKEGRGTGMGRSEGCGREAED